jgi:hypothetical protein
MAEPIVIKTETVQAWTVQLTDDGRHTAIVFKVQSGTAAFAFSPDDFSRFAGGMIAKAAKLAGQLPAQPLDEAETVLLPVNEVSFESHPTERSSAIVAPRIGKLRLAFVLDASALLQAFKHFLDRRRVSLHGAPKAEKPD